jgi:uncharacterized membrane protein
MNEFFKMDIFFIIASVMAIILTVLIVILLIYLIRFVRNLKYISDKARAEIDRVSLALSNLRENIHKGGVKAKHAISFIKSVIKK